MLGLLAGLPKGEEEAARCMLGLLAGLPKGDARVFKLQVAVSRQLLPASDVQEKTPFCTRSDLAASGPCK